MNYNSAIIINETKISIDSPTYFVADIAANHDNDLGRAKELIWLVAECGAHAAKFQHFSAKTIVSDHGFRMLGTQSSHQSKWKKSIYETYEDASLDIEWTGVLKETCDKARIDFFTTPYSLSLVDAVDLFVPAYKIGSGDITHLEIIDYISKKNKPVLLATGASSLIEVKTAVESILKNNKNIVLMQCNTNYTGSAENFRYVNLNVLNTFRKEYPGMILGLSDHTKGDSTVLAAIALGARVIEKHFTDDNNREGPDHSFSMNPASWKAMIERSKEVEFSLGNGIKEVEGNEKETVILQRRCLRLTKDLPSQHVLTSEDMIALRPAPENSYPPYKITDLIGKSLIVPKKEGDAIMPEDIITGK